jgi:hypothetical protein
MKVQIVSNGSTILAATTIIHQVGLRPLRVVLRLWRDEYVVHTEMLALTGCGDDESPFVWVSNGFDTGNYFKLTPEGFKRATADFMDRASKLFMNAAEHSADPECYDRETKARVAKKVSEDVDDES